MGSQLGSQWIEGLKAGEHVARNGRVKRFTTADLDTMVKKYDPSQHEAPVVIGHPKTNAPAYGWIDQVKRVGDTLYYTEKQTEPVFDEMRRAGRFKKRSMAVYPDLTIKHIGWLGAVPPAIKGLKDAEFSEDEDFEIYEFEEVEPHEPNKPNEPTEKEKEDMPTIEELQKKLAAEKAARETAEKDAKTWKGRAEKSETDFSESQANAQKKEIGDYVEQGIKDGKILPGWKEKGIVEFMEAIDGVTENETNTFEFSEGKKQTPGAWFKEFLAEFSEHPLFKEMTKPDADGKTGDDTTFDFSEPLTDKV